jgi:hypothetical protein
MGLQSGGDFDRLRDVAGEMGASAPALFDALVQMRRRSPGPCKVHDIVARCREGPGDACTETFGGSGREQSAATGTAHRFQIQRRMLARIAICASQPAVNASVRARGMPAT